LKIKNVGFKGNNIGVLSKKRHYVCILNPDTVVEDTFIKVLAFAKEEQKLKLG
jgi:GT2 family glycosyltransferase